MSMIDNLDEYTENINHEREETFSPEQVDYMKECEKAENFTDPMYQQLVAHLYSLFLTRHPTGTAHPVNTHNNVIYNYFQGNNEFVMVGELTKWDFREKLASLKMPTLLTFGEFDTMPLSAARRMHQTLSNSRLTLTPDGGHCHNTDNPKAFFTSLTKFLHDVENNTFKGE